MKSIKYPALGMPLSDIAFGTALTIGIESESKKYNSAIIHKVWDVGIRIFDTSNNYGDGRTEEVLGRILKSFDRSSFILKSKVGWTLDGDIYSGSLSKKHINDQINSSLKRLQTDYLDIYYAHRYDPDTPLREVAHSFTSLINSGKVNYWATSQWPLQKLVELEEICKKYNYIPPIAEQFIFNPIINDVKSNGVYNFLSENGKAMFGFSPLCQGILTGKYKSGSIPQGSRIEKSSLINYDKTGKILYQYKKEIFKFLEVCEKHNIDPKVASILWCKKNRVIPIIGASKVYQLDYIEQLNKSNFDNSVFKNIEVLK